MKTSFALATSVLALTSSAISAETEPWTYKANESDLLSPPQWFRQYPDCNGVRQSPIDITPAPKTHPLSTLPIEFTGSCPSFNIKQYWESFKAEAVNGSCALDVNGKAYNFAQVHFHAPSEHTIEGKAMDGELHFVHKAADGSIAVVGLFIEKRHPLQLEIKTDSFLCNFLKELKHVNETHPVSASLGSFFPTLKSSILQGRVFNYPGSLTTPTCSENVEWWVLEKPLSVSEAEFADIHNELKRIGAADDGNNARPTQPLNGRTITVY